MFKCFKLKNLFDKVIRGCADVLGDYNVVADVS